MTIKIRGREIDGLIFDVDGTFYDQEAQRKIFNSVQLELAKALLEFSGSLNPDKEEIEEIRQKYLAEQQRIGSWARAFEKLGGDDTTYRSIADNTDRSQHLSLNPQLLDLLSGVQTKTKLSILTSAPRAVTINTCRAILGHDWENLFAAVVCSDSSGLPAEKPDPQAFLYVLNLIGVESTRTAMMGDSYSADIGPATALGMLTIYVGDQDGIGDLRISRIEYLRNLIE